MLPALGRLVKRRRCGWAGPCAWLLFGLFIDVTQRHTFTGLLGDARRLHNGDRLHDVFVRDRRLTGIEHLSEQLDDPLRP